MPHLTVLGTQSPARSCDPRRTACEGRDDVTPAIRTSPGLLAGRYLHTISVDCGRVSIALVGNGSPALRNSKARSGYERMPAGPDHSRRRSGCSAADLTASEGNRASGGHVATQRHSEDTTELPATNRAARSAISMAGPASADIGVAEVHDSVTRPDKISYEGVGFAEPAAVSAVTILEGPVTDGR